MSEKFWYRVARNFIKAGRLPIRVSDSVIEIVKTLLTEEQARLTLIFKKPSYNIDQLKDKIDINDKVLTEMLNELMRLGIVSGIPSRTTGVMVYRLLPFLPGLLETTFMKGQTGEKDKKLAQLYQDLFDEIVQGTQTNYDQMLSEFEKTPALDRVIPIEEEIETKQEVVLPFEELSKIIENHEIIGLATCYCRHRKDLLGEPCKVTEERRNCISLGRTAEFLISQDFAERISKEKALEIMKKAEDEGLVHKAFHANLDPGKEIDGICNCCKCCCGTFETHYAGGFALMDLTSYLAKVNEENCVGCGTCIDSCNAEAIDLVDTIAVVNDNRCIGCGVCAHLCPENAIQLYRTELRRVFIPPPKI
ncbi:MAG: indolepyruvate ferredoxin oxidoreductase subunit alpha [Candidatus Hermodarchaeota archaeon]